jgi:hypothetical protein
MVIENLSTCGYNNVSDNTSDGSGGTTVDVDVSAAGYIIVQTMELLVLE